MPVFYLTANSGRDYRAAIADDEASAYAVAGAGWETCRMVAGWMGAKYMPEKMLAFVGTFMPRDAAIASLRGRTFVKGEYIFDGNFLAYETRFGIPQVLAHLEDAILDGLPDDLMQEWPVRFMSAVPIGADLSHVGWQFLHWLMIVENAPGADVVAPLANGMTADAETARAARAAEWAAENERYPRATETEARATRITEAAMDAVLANAKPDPRMVAHSIVRAAMHAGRLRESQIYPLMADKIIELIETA